MSATDLIQSYVTELEKYRELVQILGKRLDIQEEVIRSQAARLEALESTVQRPRDPHRTLSGCAEVQHAATAVEAGSSTEGSQRDVTGRLSTMSSLPHTVVASSQTDASNSNWTRIANISGTTPDGRPKVEDTMSDVSPAAVKSEQPIKPVGEIANDLLIVDDQLTHVSTSHSAEVEMHRMHSPSQVMASKADSGSQDNPLVIDDDEMKSSVTLTGEVDQDIAPSMQNAVEDVVEASPTSVIPGKIGGDTIVIHKQGDTSASFTADAGHDGGTEPSAQSISAHRLTGLVTQAPQDPRQTLKRKAKHTTEAAGPSGLKKRRHLILEVLVPPSKWYCRVCSLIHPPPVCRQPSAALSYVDPKDWHMSTTLVGSSGAEVCEGGTCTEAASEVDLDDIFSGELTDYSYDDEEEDDPNDPPYDPHGDAEADADYEDKYAPPEDAFDLPRASGSSSVKAEVKTDIKPNVGPPFLAEDIVRGRMPSDEFESFPVNLDAETRSVVVSRKLMSSKYGGSGRSMCPTIGKKYKHGYNLMYPTLAMNPHAPVEPGQPGLLCRVRKKPQWKPGNQKVLVRLQPNAYRYVGEYEMSPAAPLSTQEFNNLPLKAKTRWSKVILTRKTDRDVRFRIIYRREYGGREPTTREVGKALKDVNEEYKELTVDEILNAFEVGLEVCRCSCVVVVDFFNFCIHRQ
ncbi:hypothetical protein BKA93DRAFT_528564 [Sparassis latifolia]